MSEEKDIHNGSPRRLVPLRVFALNIGATNRSYCPPGDSITITISATYCEECTLLSIGRPTPMVCCLDYNL